MAKYQCAHCDDHLDPAQRIVLAARIGQAATFADKGPSWADDPNLKAFHEEHYDLRRGQWQELKRGILRKLRPDAE